MAIAGSTNALSPAGTGGLSDQGFDENGLRVTKKGPGLGSPWLGNTAAKPPAPGAVPNVAGQNAFTGLQVNNLTDQSLKTTGEMISGAAYSPYRTASNEAFLRAAKNLRTQTGGLNAPNVGQGSAVRAQQGTEQNILTGLTENQLAQDQAEQAMKERGLNAFQGISGEIRTQQEFGDTQWRKGWDDALLYNDPSTPEGLTRLQDMYEQKYGYRPDFNQLKEQRDYARSKQQQDITTGGLTIEGMKADLGDQKFNALMTRVNAGATIDQINSEFGAGALTPDQYGSMKNWSESGKWQAAFTQGAQQWQQEFGWTQSSFAQNLALKYQELATNADLTKLGIVSGEKIAGMRISSDEKIAGMQIDSAQKLAADQNYLTQQGIDINKAAMYGYDRADGTHVSGSLELACDQFGWEKTSFAEDLALRRETVVTDAALKREGIASEEKLAGLKISSDEKIAGMQIASAESIARDRNYLEQQGINLATAAQYGYTDANGNHVRGSMEIAGESMDLQTTQVKQTLAMAEKEFGLDSDKFAEAKRAAAVAEGFTGQQLKDAEEQFSATYGLELSKFNEQTDQWKQTFEESRVEFIASNELAQEGLGLERDKLAEAQRAAKAMEGLTGQELADKRSEFASTYGLEVDKFNTSVDQYNRQFQEDHTRWQASFDEAHNQFESQLTLSQQELDFKRWDAGERLGIAKREIAIAEQSAESASYWDSAKQFSTFATTHIDATDAQIYDAAATWYEAQYGQPPDKGSPAYQEWAKNEYAAATDSRLINPLDNMLYQINSSSMPQEAKDAMVSILTDPELIAARAGLETTPGGSTGTRLVANIDKVVGTDAYGSAATDASNPFYKDYHSILENTNAFDQTVVESSNHELQFNSPPVEGSVVKLDNTLFAVQSPVRAQFRKDKKTVYYVVVKDLTTGKTHYLRTTPTTAQVVSDTPTSW